MNDYEVLDKLRAGKDTKEIPVIMLTAKMVQADKVKALNKGLDDYITKPYDAEELLARINAVLKRSKAIAVKKVKDVLITGGAGFIGSALTEALLSKKFNVTVIDDFSTGRKENFEENPKTLEEV